MTLHYKAFIEIFILVIDTRTHARPPATMNLNQIKLSKTEWNNIEIPLQDKDIKILNVIVDGYTNLNIKYNDHKSLLSYLKIPKDNAMEIHLYNKYFQPKINKILEKMNSAEKLKWAKISAKWLNPNIRLKESSNIRIENLKNVNKDSTMFFENVLIDYCQKAIDKDSMSLGFYTLVYLNKLKINNTNKYVEEFAKFIIENREKWVNIEDIVMNSVNILEKNKTLLEYEDIKLYSHQRTLYSLFSKFDTNTTPKLVLYTAPTGTGKTLSPLGLSSGHKIIFVCVARHVGLSLAKAAISIKKKIAFAFGCETATDIRLHYYAAISYSVNFKSGSRQTVDNSKGENVEIIICDVASYLTAMYYMLSFNEEQNIITYWDEPTITMDYTEHPLHETIQRNWRENKISKMVLSSATLPSEDQIEPMITDFKTKWDNIEPAEIHTIVSHECKKSISIISKENTVILPHLLYEKYVDLLDSVSNCRNNKTLLRYFDLNSIVEFIKYVVECGLFSINDYFNKIENITIEEIKLFYLYILQNIGEDAWPNMFEHFKNEQTNYFIALQRQQSSQLATAKMTFSSEIATPEKKMSGILLTTEDAHTLTDGPAIYLVEDAYKIVKFYIQASKIPQQIIANLVTRIETNCDLYEQIKTLQKKLKDTIGRESSKEKKMTKMINEEDFTIIKGADNLNATIADAYSKISNIQIDNKYIPNTKQHQDIWCKNIHENAFVPNIDEETICQIMEIKTKTDTEPDGIEIEMKIMLLMGIGVFTNTTENAAAADYTEIIKRLATEQRLFMIIAQPDYVYGTNYQFCHGVIGKDLTMMTQQKIIQSIGRIGRQNIQQNYTVRFRETDAIRRLFSSPTENMEAANMSRLFST